ncbi:MAG: magnesium transporter CorA family protein [Streptosporangiaceae bacterium]
MGTTRTRAWRDGRVIAENFPPAEVSEHIAAGDLVWLDIHSPSEDDLRTIAEELGLDPLAVEDAISEQERAKLDRYPHHLFLNAYSTRVDNGEIVLGEISAFLTEHAMVTVRPNDEFDLDELVNRWDTSPELAARGRVAYLLHGLLDQIVDQHFVAIQSLDDEVEDLEDLLFEDGPTDKAIQRRSFRLRKSLVMLRRVVLPMREIVNTLLRRDLKVVPEELNPHFQDVYDHVLRATEWTEGLRDLVANVMDTRIALQGNRMNEVMKKVTSWAAVIAVPTAITGFYGMNVPYPGFAETWGWWASLVIVVMTSFSLYLIFKRRDWL